MSTKLRIGLAVSIVLLSIGLSATPVAISQPPGLVSTASASTPVPLQWDDKIPPPTTTTTTTAPPPPTTTTTAPPPAPEPSVPSSVPETATAPSGSHTAVIQSVFAPYGQGAVATALRVAECESAPNYATALSASGTYAGLFQVGNFWADEFLAHTGSNYYDGRFDPWANATFAAWLAYEAPGGGWSHWSCY